ncbi:MAG: hypothetical protein M1825_000291 [Sarcosagium campestre]|nr:MAG: hypothetical protein M1825_000291 [Sarcosagium campestre]
MPQAELDSVNDRLPQRPSADRSESIAVSLNTEATSSFTRSSPRRVPRLPSPHHLLSPILRDVQNSPGPSRRHSPYLPPRYPRQSESVQGRSSTRLPEIQRQPTGTEGRSPPYLSSRKTASGIHRARMRSSSSQERDMKGKLSDSLPSSLSVQSIGNPAEQKDLTDDTNDALRQIYEADLKGLRSMVVCRVCFKLLYEPFTLSCGHTFCYSCTSQWFEANRVHKTCPECRTEILQQPAPAYLVREIVNMFMNRGELMPSGETAEEHMKACEDESSCLERDRANEDKAKGGLFRGCFRRSRSAMNMYDEEDGVNRCADCGWELESGRCERCGDDMSDTGFSDEVNRMGFSEADFSETASLDTEQEEEEDLDAEIDMDDVDGALGLDGFAEGEEGFALYDPELQEELARAPWLSLVHQSYRGDLGHGGGPFGNTRQHHSRPLPDVSVTSSDTERSGTEREAAETASDDESETSSMRAFIVADDAEDIPDIPSSNLSTNQAMENEDNSEEEEADDEKSDEGGEVSNGTRRRRQRWVENQMALSHILE